MDERQLSETLQKGIKAARRGHAEPAQKLLSQVVQADPNNEEAWLWLSRVLEEPQHRSQCLQKVLEINPNNSWAAQQLAELQGATATPAPPPLPTEPTSKGQPAPAESESKYQRLQPKTSELKLEALTCPNCGGVVDIQGGLDVKTLVCNNCASVLDLTSEQAAVIGQMNRSTRPLMPIEPGMKGTFNDEVHQVIGWIRYEGWDDEERWRWEEWLLASSQGKYRWLSYDREDGFVLFEKIQPLAPFDPQIAASIQVPGGLAHVTERSPAKVVAFDGELTWQCNVGHQIGYLDAQRGGVPYSVEHTKDEIELFEGQRLSDAEVWQAFGREDLVQKATEISHWNSAYSALALFCLLLACFSCGAMTWAVFSGEELAQQEFQMAKGAEVKTVGPITLTDPGRVHRISLFATGLTVGNWAVVDVTARDMEGNSYYLFSGEFWDEEGTDSDGSWQESDTTEDFLFKLENPGDYYLDVSMEEATVDSLAVTVTLEQGVWLSRFFIIFLVISIVLAFIFFSMGQKRLVGASLMKSK